MQGNLTHDPYYDVIPGSEVPFMRFYLAVSGPGGVAQAILKGNIAQPPYFDHVGDTGRPFMRVYLAVDRPRRRQNGTGRPNADFLRVVAYDDTALFSFPYLRPGSEILVDGSLRARKRRLAKGKTQTVVEVVAGEGGVSFLRKIEWEAGDAERARIQRERASGGWSAAVSLPDRHAGGFFRVVSYGDVARLSFPYLQVGSEVLVHGRLQARKRKLDNGKTQTVVEVVARNIRFLRRINWVAGDVERELVPRHEQPERV
jgi:single-stranded DNA-binding protein